MRHRCRCPPGRIRSRPGNLFGLPVDDAGHDQREAAAAVHLVLQLAGVDPAPLAIEDVAGQSVQLRDTRVKQGFPQQHFRSRNSGERT